jgi:hypothetical protein
MEKYLISNIESRVQGKQTSFVVMEAAMTSLVSEALSMTENKSTHTGSCNSTCSTKGDLTVDEDIRNISRRRISAWHNEEMTDARTCPRRVTVNVGESYTVFLSVSGSAADREHVRKRFRICC